MAELEIKPTAAAKARVIVVILIAVAIAGTLTFLLTGGGKALFASKSTLYTYVPDSAGLLESGEVRLSGIPIGSVKKIELSGLLDPQRVVRVEMRVDTNYLRSIPADSQTSISADNIVGWEFVSIDEGKSPVPVHPDATLPSEPLKQALESADMVVSLQSKMRQVDDLLTQMSSPDTKIGQFVLRGELYDQLLSRLSAFDKSLHAFEAPDSAAGQALFSDALYTELRGYIVGVDTTLASIQRGEGTAGRLFASDAEYNDFVRDLHDFRTRVAAMNASHDDSGYKTIQEMLARTDAVIASLTAGEGTMGRLLTNPQLFESLTGSLQSMEAMLRDLREHPQKYLRYQVR